MFAVVQTGGKQYRVAVGQSIQVEKLPQVKGDAIAFDQVLMVSDGDRITAGTPLVEGAQVLATVSRQERGPKILVFRYKSKKRVRVLRGHRQSLTQLFIRDIVVNGESTAARLKPAAATPVAEPELTGAPTLEAAAVAPEAPAAAAVAAPETAPASEATEVSAPTSETVSDVAPQGEEGTEA
ncbi:MAG TPA: 50S ribosomal protein L21 [Chloroflexota bacterium]|jgi:large subunit ribosomal protein L21|nr:50S ribosomal protein L21 [Chloroflexota bacterium]